MNDRHFRIQLYCTYKDSNNDIDELNIEMLQDEEWQTLNLNIRSPGFILFINGLLSCQHLYMRANCAERNLVIESTKGNMSLIAGEYWEIKDTNIDFHVKLKSGMPTQDDLDYILGRMKHCPVSTNLPEDIRINSSIYFED